MGWSGEVAAAAEEYKEWCGFVGLGIASIRVCMWATHLPCSTPPPQPLLLTRVPPPLFCIGSVYICWAPKIAYCLPISSAKHEWNPAPAPSSPQSLADFKARISKYEEVYEPIANRNIHYIKLIDMCVCVRVCVCVRARLGLGVGGRGALWTWGAEGRGRGGGEVSGGPVCMPLAHMIGT